MDLDFDFDFDFDFDTVLLKLVFDETNFLSISFKSGFYYYYDGVYYLLIFAFFYGDLEECFGLGAWLFFFSDIFFNVLS